MYRTVRASSSGTCSSDNRHKGRRRFRVADDAMADPHGTLYFIGISLFARTDVEQGTPRKVARKLHAVLVDGMGTATAGDCASHTAVSAASGPQLA